MIFVFFSRKKFVVANFEFLEEIKFLSTFSHEIYFFGRYLIILALISLMEATFFSIFT
jgi:hypothetical protein